MGEQVIQSGGVETEGHSGNEDIAAGGRPLRASVCHINEIGFYLEGELFKWWYMQCLIESGSQTGLEPWFCHQL